jgi:NAD-specific glutamate dehydrogenase
LSNLGATTCFSSRREAPRPAGQPHESAEIVRARRLLDESFSLERAWSEINDASGRAASSTVDALVFSLRAGGTALARPHARRRLAELAEAQLHEVSARLQTFQPKIARAWTPIEVELLVAVWSDLHG